MFYSKDTIFSPGCLSSDVQVSTVWPSTTTLSTTTTVNPTTTRSQQTSTGQQQSTMWPTLPGASTTGHVPGDTSTSQSMRSSTTDRIEETSKGSSNFLTVKKEEIL